MSTMIHPDCLFCGIIERRIAAEIIDETEKTLTFLTIGPIHPGHALVITKEHAVNIQDASEGALAAVLPACQRVTRMLKQALSCENFNVSHNAGTLAGQMIGHFHMHVIPRYADDGLHPWQGHVYASEEEMHQLAERIRGFATLFKS